MENKGSDTFWLVLLIGVGVVGGILTFLDRVTPLDLPDVFMILWSFGCFFIPCFYLLSRTDYFRFHFLINFIVSVIFSVIVIMALTTALGKIKNETLNNLALIGTMIVLYAVEIIFFLVKGGFINKGQTTTDETTSVEQ